MAARERQYGIFVDIAVSTSGGRRTIPESLRPSVSGYGASNVRFVVIEEPVD